MVERVRRLVDSKTPFLIVKYKVSFIGITSNCYDIVTMYGDKLQYYPLERRDVMRVLRDFSLPLLHDAGGDGKIWGDKRFKEKFNKGGYKI
jgi:hypothetical protein